MHWTVLLIASALEAACGYPQWLYARIRHPVVWMGACLTFLEQNCNQPRFSAEKRKGLGAASLAALLALTLGLSLGLQALGTPVQILCIAALLAQKSLYAHVREVLTPLRQHDLPAARTALKRIVGRDVEALDEAAVSRAAIESLSESFSDGVAAPLFWAACFGLPGIACYKAVNTADSMIGHRDARYLAFGWAAARLDDVANYIPARLSAAIIALVSLSPAAWRTAWRDARKHASPNAGWPEAAMAGALGLRLGGPRSYGGETHHSPFIGTGTPDATPEHLQKALRIYVLCCGCLWLMLLLPLLAPR